jgi:hypothetical protein
MRNKVQLYIGGERADLDNGSFLLLNYTQEDLENPTAVKNLRSRQITLKGTPANDKIFGNIYRNDRVTQYGGNETGVDFDPTRKTSFVIYNDRLEILESGYLKLDKIITNGKRRDYAVTLYGGLGSFLYGLSYKANGDQMSLADLDFGETLDFTINRSTVFEAWTRLGHGTGPAKWDILNFMPGYFGLPPTPFDANKCVVAPTAVGLKYSEDGYHPNANGFTLVTLNEKVTGNDAKDYRSYLQKPVIKMSKVIQAICDQSNNGGWTVNLDEDFFDNTNPYWEDVWMTLPLLNDLNINETTVTTTQTMTALDTVLPIVGGGSGNVQITVNADPYAYMLGLPSLNYKLWCRNATGLLMNYLVLTVTLYDSSNNVLTTAVYRIGTSGATLPSYYQQPDFWFDHIDGSGYFVDSNGDPVTFPLFAEADGAAYYKVQIGSETYWNGSATPPAGSFAWTMWETGETVFADGYTCDARMSGSTVDVVAQSSSTVRTGATITQSALLSGSKTPADYLLSFCKTFGLLLLCHKDTKEVDIILRRNFYSGGTVNINGRIDRSRTIEKVPFAFAAKWYLFGNEAKGEFAEYYKANHGRPFGQYRVNTGYDFDAEQKNMTESIVFSNAVSVMETSKYFCDLVKGAVDIPAVFLAGGKYNLYNGSETKSFDLPNLFDATKTWTNPTHPMHDNWAKVQFHGKENAHIDERDTLVFFGGMEDTSAEHLSLTDDSENMLSLNGNVPCWLPNVCDLDPSVHITEMPHFSRYVWSGSTINDQLDWGDPVELQIPGVIMGVNSNVFDQFWKKYIADRYDDDSAVVTCYVDLRGMQVNETLFRGFYAFDGAIWALNQIIDHSLTTFGPTKCEFVKVQNTTNYTTNL